MGNFTFRVRKLPDPTPYILVGDNRFKGGGLAKASLLGATGIKAAKTTGSMSGRQWYTIDGRTLPEEPREKGVYLVKDKRGMKKTIKK